MIRNLNLQPDVLMEEENQDLPGPGPATLQMRMLLNFQMRNLNLQPNVPMEEGNQDLLGLAAATLEMNLQMAAQVEEEEMELDDEEEAHGIEEVAAPEENVACCSCPLQSRYNVPNRECSGGEKCQNESRIPPNADFMGLIEPSSNGSDYCMECFAVEDRKIQKERYMKKKNENDKFEEVLRCSRCMKLWHICCSFHMKRSNGFKCKFCVKNEAPKILDAGKGRCRIVTMMEDKLNAILEEQQGKIFFMLYTHEYKNPANQKSWFAIDYLDSVKYLEADRRKQINQEILSHKFFVF
ncbi:Protein CBG01991 [Caenorhabditis briggsae]|uniref:histone acetyltransferase n=1 Tax=Caenorhabditis briggsae TaxID=6238 RepID=A8WRR4_CAEBR|nr:Protein CBG01991 [Caenorhabditis briggsae]CAP23172.2 Protein CBG01991 [Caenorhabditis briggsae]